MVALSMMGSTLISGLKVHNEPEKGVRRVALEHTSTADQLRGSLKLALVMIYQSENVQVQYNYHRITRPGRIHQCRHP